MHAFRKAIALAGIAVAALLASTLPADAAGYNIGTGAYSRTTFEGRCEVTLGKAFCLWYSYSASESGIAYHAQQYGSVGIPNLNGYYFTGGGSGNGQAVRNNAAAMDCTVYVSNNCKTYYSPGYGGNYDWAEWGRGGRLHYTWNNEASYYVD